MEFPKDNLFHNPSFGSQNPTGFQSVLPNPSSSFFSHSTIPSSMTSGSFGSPSAVFGKWSGGFQSPASSFSASSEANTRFISAKLESASSQHLFGAPPGQAPSPVLPGLFGAGQVPSFGSSVALGGNAQVSHVSNRPADSSFFGQTAGANYFSTSGGEFDVSNVASKARKFESNEPSGKTLFGKAIPAEAEKRVVDSREKRELPRTVKPPDLMSLFPGKGAPAKLFGKPLTGVDQHQLRGIAPAIHDSPSMSRISRPTSRHSSPKINKDPTVDSRGGDDNYTETYGEKDMKQEPALRRRRVTSDADRRVLIVKGIPPRFNNQVRLRSHFMNYGDVDKISTNPKADSAIVFFSSHESAERAKEHGRCIPGVEKPVLMFWRAEPRQRPVRQTSETKEAKGRGSGAEMSPHCQRKTEVDEELASMQGPQDIQAEEASPRTTGPRPQGSLERSETTSQADHQRRTPPPPPASTKTPESGALATNVTFKSLVGSVGRTAGEKFTILEIRDKLLKAALGSQKQADLATAKAIKGTCQDMCPEKERYMREDRRRLSYYEIVPGTDQLAGKLPQVDHSRAVKEYSRSSADQDMPLAQELRPPEVLHATMNYLLTHIIDTGGAGKWVEWYDFLWNRTRSIRKDITQQHLCDPVAVSLVEKCARFHIYCSEVLCEEDAVIFDPKINNENLTKCLQTLKEMYHDLHVRQNIACLENEGEFAMYMVLMNLNKGDILREVQQLNSEVRDSDYVNFSIHVYSALNSTNYIKFFKLVHAAPFLGACVLHRYFNQIRTSALQRMVKAYAQPGHGATYPVSELMRQLGFETKEEVENFSRHHGLVVENGQIQLDKNRFSDSEAFPVLRSLNLVEGKQKWSLGEVINGGPLAPCIVREPFSSFDENGHFICGDDCTTAGVKLSDVEFAPTNVPPTTIPEGSDTLVQPSVPSQPAFSNELVKNCARELILELLNAMCFDIAKSQMNDVQSLLYVGNSLAEELLMDTCAAIIKDECLTAADELAKEREAQHRLARHRAMVLEEACQEVLADIFDETLVNLIRSVTFEEHRTITELTRRRAFNAVTELLIDQLMQDVCASDAKRVCHDVFTTDVTERLEALAACQKSVERLHLGRAFRKWKAQFSAHRRLRQAMETFPPAPSMQVWSDQFSSLVPGSDGVVDDSLHLGGSVSVTLKPPQELYQDRLRLLKEIRDCKAHSKWRHDVSWTAFDLSQMMINLQLPQKFSRAVKGSNIGLRLYWKLIVALPDVSENMEQESGIHDWLEAKFSNRRTPVSSEFEPVNVVALSSVPLKESELFCSFSSLNICVVSVTDRPMPDASVDKNHLLGSSGVLFVLRRDLSDASQDLQQTDELMQLWKNEAERLKDLLASKPQQPKIPLAVLCCTSDACLTEDVVNGLELQRLKLDDVISNFRVFSLDPDIEDPQTSRELEGVVRWIMLHCPKPLRMKCVNVRDFVEDCLSSDFFTPVLENLAERRKRGLLQMPVNRLISLYNDVIQWLSSVASNAQLYGLSWPVIEFSSDHEDLPDANWNSVNQLQRLRDLICCLKLPEFSQSDEEELGDWSVVCADVWNYVDSIIDIDRSCSRFLSRIDVLIRKAEDQFRLLCAPSPWSSLDRGPLPFYANFPWLEFIMICIEYQIDCILPADRDMDDLKVYFQVDAVEPFNSLSLSLEMDLEKLSSAGEASLLSTVMTAVKRKRLSARDESPLPIRKKYSVALASAPLEQSENAERLAEQQESLNRLRSAVTAEKQKSAEFEEFLKMSLCLSTSPEASSIDLEDEFPSNCMLQRDSSLNLAVPGEHKSLEPSASVSDKIKDLNALIKSERTANRMFEIYLDTSVLTDLE